MPRDRRPLTVPERLQQAEPRNRFSAVSLRRMAGSSAIVQARRFTLATLASPRPAAPPSRSRRVRLSRPLPATGRPGRCRYMAARPGRPLRRAGGDRGASVRLNGRDPRRGAGRLMAQILRASACRLCGWAAADGHELYCRRWPPMVHPVIVMMPKGPVQQAAMTNFPNVRAEWWCGEWKPRIEAAH
jgi:hypothetical protein